MTSPTALREAMARAHLDARFAEAPSRNGSPMPDETWREMLEWYEEGRENPESCVHYANPAISFRAADAILRAIDAAGWQIVPKVPTPEMDAAGVDTMLGLHESGTADDVYRAMLAAAPRITDQ